MLAKDLAEILLEHPNSELVIRDVRYMSKEYFTIESVESTIIDDEPTICIDFT